MTESTSRKAAEAGAARDRGVAALISGDVAAAEAEFRRAASGNPLAADAWHGIAAALLQRGQSGPALPHHRRAILLAPEQAACWAGLGRNRLVTTPDGAATAFRRAILSKPDAPQGWAGLGWAERRRHNRGAARSSFRRSHLLGPSRGEALLGLGALAQEHGDPSAMASAYRRATILEPGSEVAAYLAGSVTGGRPAAAPRAYIVEQFNQFAAQFDDHLVRQLHYQAPALMRSAVDRVAPGRRFERVLDLGCGTGLAALAFRDRVGEVWGVDLANRMLAKAAERGLFDHLVEDDVLRFLETTEVAFDLLLAADLVIYIGDLAPLMERIAARAAPGAMVALSTEHEGEGHDWSLAPTGRFRHHPAYVERTAAQHGLRLLHRDDASVRRQAGEPVMGGIYVFSTG